jgi:hypothetical protein
MKQNNPTNLINESHHWITVRKNSIVNICVFIFTITTIGISIYSCKKDEPEVQEISPPSEETLPDNNIELAKWAEGKSFAGSIAMGLRAYAAEHGANGDYNNITIEKLGLEPDDLYGHYFRINNFQLSDVSFDQNRSEYHLRYTITINSPDESWKIKSLQLLDTGQWIQQP